MHVKCGLKIPNSFGKISQSLRGDFFDSHSIVVGGMSTCKLCRSQNVCYSCYRVQQSEH